MLSKTHTRDAYYFSLLAGGLTYVAGAARGGYVDLHGHGSDDSMTSGGARLQYYSTVEE